MSQASLRDRMVSVLDRIGTLLQGRVDEAIYPSWRRDVRKLFQAVDMLPGGDAIRPVSLNLWRWAYAEVTETQQMWIVMARHAFASCELTEVAWNTLVKHTLAQ